MTIVLILIFLLLATLAAGFALVPLLRGSGYSPARRAVLAASVGLFVLGGGGGLYAYLGSPGLALRALTGPKDSDLPGLVAELAGRVKAHPRDEMAWELLGRGYLTLGAPAEAAAALRKAVPLAPPDRQPELLASYGEALTLANAGQVPDSALPAFQAALRLDPKQPAARYYLGLALAGRGRTGQAAAIWQALLDDSPPDASYRPLLIDKLAALKAQGAGGGPPDIAAMVAKLAASLKAAPRNPPGWERLIRAYAVLGDKDKAGQALRDARAALKADPAALSGIEAEAKGLGVGG